MTEMNVSENIANELKDALYEIKSVSNEIKLIGINAAIESARAAAGIRKMMDDILDGMMVGNCRMIAKLLEAKALSIDSKEIDAFAKWIGVDEIYITDQDGVTTGTNKTDAIGWAFPDDPKAQAFVFRRLIGVKDGVVTQPITMRDLDSKLFKFVGVSRIDQPGIVQVGLMADSIAKYQVEIGNVFGLLATEIRNLSNKVKTSVKRMSDVTEIINKS